ncbi:MGMT family protein [Pseudoalteromonas sp. T1lg24]|uniref:MGMT family protein n=1 Tax=Pseudoalteromonas sp. T1lg24 TaxID=2077099 RepID=UPI000CF61290|nr:MGMT family protein [Pseudoalteromonas sp. T1lg24]
MTQEEKVQAILLVVGSIPSGKVCTYGKVAEMASLNGHARLVGTVMKKLPTGSRIPWFRVINSQGKISFPENSEKYQQQKSLLEQEGIVFKGTKVNLKVAMWQV